MDDALVFNEPPEEGYQALLEHLGKLDERMRRNKRNQQARNFVPRTLTSTPQTSGTPVYNPPQPPTASFIPRAPAVTPTANRPDLAPGPMQGVQMHTIGAKYNGPRPQCTPEEKERRRQTNSCFYCGEPGCKVGTCPRKAQRQSHQRYGMNAIQTPPYQDINSGGWVRPEATIVSENAQSQS